jgi:hypothetical protein
MASIAVSRGSRFRRARAAVAPNTPAVAGRKKRRGVVAATPSAMATSTPATTAASTSSPL